MVKQGNKMGFQRRYMQSLYHLPKFSQINLQKYSTSIQHIPYVNINNGKTDSRGPRGDLDQFSIIKMSYKIIYISAIYQTYPSNITSVE